MSQSGVLLHLSCLRQELVMLNESSLHARASAMGEEFPVWPATYEMGIGHCCPWDEVESML